MSGLLGAPYWAMLTVHARLEYFYTTLLSAFANVVGILRTYVLPRVRIRRRLGRSGSLTPIQLNPGRVLD